MVIQLDSLWGVIIIVMMVTYVVFSGIFWLRRKPRQAPTTKVESRSRLGIFIQVIGFALIWAIPRRVSGPPFPLRPPFEALLAIFTLLIGPLSCLLEISAVRTLGKQWAYVARVVEGHELITTGPYNVVRNPIYLGMLGMLLMTGLAWTRWWALLIAIVVFLIGTTVRIRSEEKILRATFGEKFDEYASRVPALIPWLL
jgi:protein-S-isoprenylcysteine O-methyltransferase Ste14